ncbi:MAG: glyoxalase, partial [Coriobacteriales bacterium]|nr:glyoxalase [Coriobacteriales bacterium]
GLVDQSSANMAFGYTHMAFALGSKSAVDELTERLRADGYEILSGPRVTGDGYYETSLIGWEGINIEITV